MCFFAKVRKGGRVGESDPLSSDPLSSDALNSDDLSSDPLSISDYLGLFVTISDYLGLSRTISTSKIWRCESDKFVIE